MDQNRQVDISCLKLKQVKPAGVTEADFASALDEWTATLGATNVYEDEASCLLQYYDPWSLTTPERYAPSGVLPPTFVEHIQTILSVANKYSVPLWTVSRGKNLV
jgi:4-cresol dehydrogenase (hydroxylating)